MINTRDIDDIIGSDALDTDNDKIGKVSQVYLDSESDEPVWVSVKSGLFGTSETLVPLSGADWDRSALHVAFSKERVKDAPRVEPDAELSPAEQDRLYDYYGLGDGSGAGTTTGGVDDRSDAGTGDGLQQRDRTTVDGAVGGASGLQQEDAATTRGTSDGTSGYQQEDVTATSGTTGGRSGFQQEDATTTRDTTSGGTGVSGTGGSGFTAGGHDTSGPTTDDAMTRSEERLRVGTEQVETGKARLRKYVVSEQQSVNVPVTHEEVRVEREPITDANRGDALEGPNLSEEEHEVVLTEERPVVEKETVPVERVRLGTEEVTENRQVTEDVRHEEITTDGDAESGTRNR